MLKTEIINGKVFLTQTTYYLYKSEEEQKKDQPSLITSDKRVFDYHKKREKTKLK